MLELDGRRGCNSEADAQYPGPLTGFLSQFCWSQIRREKSRSSGRGVRGSDVPLLDDSRCASWQVLSPAIDVADSGPGPSCLARALVRIAGLREGLLSFKWSVRPSLLRLAEAVSQLHLDSDELSAPVIKLPPCGRFVMSSRYGTCLVDMDRKSYSLLLAQAEYQSTWTEATCMRVTGDSRAMLSRVWD